MKADGTSPPIGRFLIGHLTKVNSVSKTFLHFYLSCGMVLNNYNIIIISFFSLLVKLLNFVTNWCLKEQILKHLKLLLNWH